MAEARDPVTIAQAARRMHKHEPTVRVWASRHHARKLAISGKTVWYDYHDLAAIESFLFRKERVPKTPEDRDEHRRLMRERPSWAA